MDLLMISDVYFPRVNGVSTSIRTHVRALVALGHRVTLVAPDYGPAFAAEQRARDAEFGDAFAVIRVPARVLFFDPEDRLMTGRGLRAVREELAARRWDAVHVHTPFRAHAFGVRVARECGAPVVETYHTYFEEYVAHYLPWLPGPVLRLFARRLSRKLCHEVDHLVVPTTEMTEVFARYGIRTPSTVLPTGIDLDEFAGGDGARFRTAHGIDATVPVVATVSRLAIEKNIPFLLEVAGRLVREFRRCVSSSPAKAPTPSGCASCRDRTAWTRTCCSSATSIDARTCSTATAPRTPSSSPRPPKRRDWC